MTGRKILTAFYIMVTGAVLFWGVDALVHVIRGPHLLGRDVLLLTFILPVVPMAAFGFIVQRRISRLAIRTVAWSLVGGIWLFGPLLMGLSLSMQGLGFTNVPVDRLGTGVLWLLALGVLPISTLMMSAYDQSTFALLGASLGLPVMAEVVAKSPVTFS